MMKVRFCCNPWCWKLTAALYLAWARHFEQKGMKDQADAVYLKALENQAQPHHRLRPAGPVRLHTVHSQNAVQRRLLPG
uniref:BUB1 N-terminal domain-containing protein n=1 Tax=Xiphophorus maculatus TaxID=8083 RepID=A0A3B5QEQ3_XIPMA